MTPHHQALKAALATALAAGVVIAAPAACARSAHGATRIPSSQRHVRLYSIRIEDQIRLVQARVIAKDDLGPTALRIYRLGGLSTSEPDAQAVKEAASGSLLTGRSG